MYALILAGGKGERLRPLTDEVPKPMVQVSGQPILWHQVRRLADAGVTDVVFLVGYLGEVVEEYFGDGKEFGIRAHYSREDSPLGRGGALKKGLAVLGDVAGPVLATNGDVITDADAGPAGRGLPTATGRESIPRRQYPHRANGKSVWNR